MYTHLKTINSCIIKLVLGIGDWCCYCEVITQKKNHSGTCEDQNQGQVGLLSQMPLPGATSLRNKSPVFHHKGKRRQIGSNTRKSSEERRKKNREMINYHHFLLMRSVSLWNLEIVQSRLHNLCLLLSLSNILDESIFEVVFILSQPYNLKFLNFVLKENEESSRISSR